MATDDSKKNDDTSVVPRHRDVWEKLFDEKETRIAAKSIELKEEEYKRNELLSQIGNLSRVSSQSDSEQRKMKDMTERFITHSSRIEELTKRKASTENQRFEKLVDRKVTSEYEKADVTSRGEEFTAAAVEEAKETDLNLHVRKKAKLEEKYRRAKLEIPEAAAYLVENKDTGPFQEKVEEYSKAVKERAQLFATERQKKKMGYDIDSRLQESQKNIISERERVEKRDISRDAAQGKFGTLKEEEAKLSDIGSKLPEALENVVKASKELAETLDNSKEGQDKLNETYEEASKTQVELNAQYKKQKDVVDEVRRSGMSGGGTQQTAQSLLGIAAAGIDVTRYAAITSEKEQLRLRTAMANVANQQFGDYVSASKGDFSAIHRIENIKFAEDESKTMRSRETGVSALEGAAQVGDAALRLTAGTTSAATIIGAAPGLDALEKSAKSGGAAAKIGIGLGKSIPQGFSQVEWYGLSQEARTAFMEQRSRREGALTDAGMNIYTGVQGAGTALQMMENLMDKGFVKKAAAMGFDTKDIARLTARGLSDIGVPFEKDTTKTLGRAMELDRARKVSAEQYMGMTGQLTQMGGSSKQLEDIISTAVARGSDNAKVFQQMTNSIEGLSSSFGGDKGADVTGTITTMMNRAMESYTKSFGGGANEYQKIAMARNVIERGSAGSVAQSMDYAGAMRYSRTVSTFKGIDPLVAKMLGGTDIIATNTLKDLLTDTEKDPIKKKQKIDAFLSTEKGLPLSEFVYDKGGNLKKDALKSTEEFRKMEIETILETKGGRARITGGSDKQNEKDYREIERKAIAGERLSFSEARRMDILPDTFVALSGNKAKGTGEETKIREPKEGSAQDAAQKISTAAAETGLKLISLGKATDTLSKGFSDAAELLKKTMSTFDPDKLQTKALDSAKNLEITQGAPVKELTTALNELTAAIRLSKMSDFGPDKMSGHQSTTQNRRPGVIGPNGKTGMMDQ